MRWNGTERNYAADILKGIGIVFVVITHFSWSSTERRIYLFPFWIDMAVPVFMIISGFAHSASFEKRHIEKIRLAYAGGGFGVCRVWVFLCFVVSVLFFVFMGMFFYLAGYVGVYKIARWGGLR